jgi:hypothetical protein
MCGRVSAGGDQAEMFVKRDGDLTSGVGGKNAGRGRVLLEVRKVDVAGVEKWCFSLLV